MKQLKFISQARKQSQLTEMLQSLQEIECINCDPKLSAEHINYMAVCDDTHQGRALSLQNLIECKSCCIVCYGACLLSDEVHIAD